MPAGPGERLLLSWLELGGLSPMLPPWVSDVDFCLISRDLLAVAAPQEHPSCLVLQVRAWGGVQGVLEGHRCRARACQPLLSSTSSADHLGIRDWGA